MEEEIKKTIDSTEKETMEPKTNGETEQPKNKDLGKKNKDKKKKIDKEKDELIKTNLELKEKLLRLNAEMQNMRRRFDNDLANAYKYDGFELVEKLLPIIDNFERAMNVKQEGSEKFLVGFKMIYDNLIAILASKGITEIECLHKEFDPSVMNAVMTEENKDYAANIVLDVMQKGYKYNDKLIRPAMVKVNNKGDT